MPPPASRPAAALSRLRGALSRSLFPAGDPSRSVARLEAEILFVALLSLATVLSLLRLGLSTSLNTVWAEDGPIYLQAALSQGFWDALFSPYAGYLVLVPRLIGEAGAAVPLQQAAATISIVSALVAALSGLAVWFASAGHIRDPYLRGALAIATVLAATAGQETLNSAAYAPWFMLVAAFWLLFFRPRGLSAAILAGLFLLATGLSTPGVWFFLPLAALRAVTAANKRDAILVGGYAVGAAVQVPVVLGQQQDPGLWTSNIWTAYLQRVVDSGIFGERLGGNLWEHFGWTFLTLFCIALLIALLVGLWRTTPGGRWFAAVAIPTSALMFFASVYQRTVADNIFWSIGDSGGTASRYVMVPALLMLSALVVVLDGAIRRLGRAWRWWLAAPAVGVILLAVAVSFDMSGDGRGGPPWDEALRAAANKCVSQGEELAGIATAPEPFGVQVPCSDVASYADPGVGALPESGIGEDATP